MKKTVKTTIITIFITMALIIGIIIAVVEKGNHVYNDKIKSITIKYYEGYGIISGDMLDDTIPLNTINLQSDDLNNVSKLIKKT